jgi:hypothetical protein
LREGNPIAQFAQIRRQIDSDSTLSSGFTAGYGMAALQAARQQHRPFTFTQSTVPDH